VTEVHGDQRVIEIARMLSGQSDSDVAQKHARELLKHANV
jgi:DNA repair ATPase RecN